VIVSTTPRNRRENQGLAISLNLVQTVADAYQLKEVSRSTLIFPIDTGPSKGPVPPATGLRRQSRLRPTRYLSVPLMAVLGLGCAAGGAGRKARGPTPVVEGVWEGFAQDTIAEGVGAGDTRMERQAWHLRQKGAELSGFYVVELTMVSGDGRPYLCSREPRFSTLLRFEVRGRAGSDGIEIEEVGDALAKGPCRPVFRSPTRFQAKLAGDVMNLRDGGHRVTLYRRPLKETSATRQLLAFERPDRTWVGEPAFPTLDSARTASAAGPGTPVADTEPPVEVGGVWVWEHKGRVSDGDEKLEREEWHLEQTGSRLSGYYDRSVRQVSTDGQAYRCSNALDFKVTTRYHLAGEVKGSRIVLYERSFEILEGSPCDSGQRRLDAYQGEAALDELRLMWGVGTQVLRRDRQDIPSQRF
jgi:hypothetical protein